MISANRHLGISKVWVGFTHW